LDQLKNKSSGAFWSRVNKTDGCWLWAGAVAKNGYGYVRWGNRLEVASRIAWELTHREKIPDSMYICHSCDNPTCVNPEHLFMGTPHDNYVDCIVKGRAVFHNRLKTHCKNGHRYDSKNTYYRPSTTRPGRNCRACLREAWRKRIGSIKE